MIGISIELGEELLDRFIAWPGTGKLNWIKYLRFLPWNRKQLLKILYVDRWQVFEDVISSWMNTDPVKLKLRKDFHKFCDDLKLPFIPFLQDDGFEFWVVWHKRYVVVPPGITILDFLTIVTLNSPLKKCEILVLRQKRIACRISVF